MAETKKFTCNTDGCVREFPTEIALTMHRRRVHSAMAKLVAKSEDTIKCEQCGVALHRNNKARHMRTAHNVFVRARRKSVWKQQEAPPIPSRELRKPEATTLGEVFERKRLGRPPGKKNLGDQVACPECGRAYARASLSTHLRDIHGFYRTQPRDPKNQSKVKRILGRTELNVQTLPPYKGDGTTALIATRHFEFTRTNGSANPTNPADSVPPIETDEAQSLAIRIQALIQIAEMIAKI